MRGLALLVPNAVEESAKNAPSHDSEMQKMMHHFIARGDRPAAVRPASWDLGLSHLSHNYLGK